MKIIIEKLARNCLFVFLLLSLISGLAIAEDIVTINATVTGNQEQPKIMYIIPWQEAKDDSLLNAEFTSRLENTFQHTDAATFERQTKMYQTIQSDLTDQN